MDIDKAIALFDKVIESLDIEMSAISEEVAQNALALITNRIQQEGLPGKNKYSTKKIPAFILLLGGGRALDTEQTRTAIRKKAEAGEDANWTDVRIAHGNQVAFVDLTFTGRMWQNTGVVSTARSGDIFIAVLGGLNKEVQNKLRWNAQRYGNFFAVNQEEADLLNEILANRIGDAVKTILNQ